MYKLLFRRRSDLSGSSRRLGVSIDEGFLIQCGWPVIQRLEMLHLRVKSIPVYALGNHGLPCKLICPSFCRQAQKVLQQSDRLLTKDTFHSCPGCHVVQEYCRNQRKSFGALAQFLGAAARKDPAVWSLGNAEVAPPRCLRR